MKTQKIIFASAIAVIFIIAMIVYKDTMTFENLIYLLSTNILGVLAIYLWLTKEEEKQKRKAAEHKTEIVKKDFHSKTGMSYTEYKQKK